MLTNHKYQKFAQKHLSEDFVKTSFCNDSVLAVYLIGLFEGLNKSAVLRQLPIYRDTIDALDLEPEAASKVQKSLLCQLVDSSYTEE